MTLKPPLSGNISAYAPTMTNPDEVKDKFYDDLDSVISATSHTDKLILFVAFSARAGTDHQTWKGVIESEDIGKYNGNGLLLLIDCRPKKTLLPPLGNFADIVYLKEQSFLHRIRDVCTL